MLMDDASHRTAVSLLDSRDAQWPFAYIIVRPSKSGFRQYPVIRTRVSPSPKRRAACNLRWNSWDRGEGYIHVVEYVRDSNYGLCPAVMATTVRRFPLGMTIDDRGVARATSFSFLFFFNSLFPPLSPPVRWERKPDRGSLRPLWCWESSTTSICECKRDETWERYEGWTKRTGVNRLNLPTPYRHMRAMRLSGQ